jgi:hypothetical protein
MENIRVFVDQYILLGVGTHLGFTIVDGVMVGSYAIWFLIILRLLYLKGKNEKDARYIRNEMIYAMALFAPLCITIKLQFIPFLLVNLGFYCLLVWAARCETKAILANEQIGVTGNWPKDMDLQAGEFRRMITEEKDEYFEKLAERQCQMGWRYEIKPLTMTLVYWLPALVASVFAHLYYM